MKRLHLLLLLVLIASYMNAQSNLQLADDNFTNENYQRDRSFGRSDSIQGQHKEIPRGLKMWTIDETFGDRTATTPDTLSPMFMNTIFTEGLRGEYNTLGNLGSPRQNRIFIDRQQPEFVFVDPYDFFVTRPSEHKFTSTYSPITIIDYNTAGDRLTGSDHFRALFAVNAGKRWGFGFKFDYIYGRGYYSDQSTSHFNYSMWGTYTGDRYQANLLFSLNHQKIAENGGITNDAYITHPEQFNESFGKDEIPTQLVQNWNRNDNQHIFFNHRYSLGFNRKVPMTGEEIEARKFALKSEAEQKAKEAKDRARRRAEKNGEEFDEEEYEEQLRLQQQNSGRPDGTIISTGRPESAAIAGLEPEHPADNNGRISVNLQDSASIARADSLTKPTTSENEWMKNEYVPVTSFIHTLQFDNYRRIYQAYDTPDSYYANDFYTPLTYTGDSIYDKTRYWTLRNTVGIALLEGFNKWAKAGLKAFASYELRHYELPTIDAGVGKWNVHNLSIGGQLLKTQGSTLHFNISAEAWLAGRNSGQLHIDGTADVNFRLLGDTMQLAANAFFHNDTPSFYYQAYHSRHFWWDNDGLDKQLHTQIAGVFSLKHLGTRLRVAFDNLKNYTYLAQSYDLITSGDNLLQQNTTVAARQHSGNISVITLQLRQDLAWKALHWDNEWTLQKSSNADVLPLPTFNVYTNLYLRFKIARVLKCDFGADARWFTKYYAPSYSPGLGQYTVQEGDNRTEIGGYPIVNVYLNFNLQHTRFFVLYSHANYSSGNNGFLVPHYPINSGVLHFGLSWNFFN